MEIFDKVTAILSELSGMDNFSLEHQLQGDLTLDSIQMVTLLIMIEDCFLIVLDETDMNPFELNTVYDVVKLVRKYTGGDMDEYKEN